MIEKLKSRKLIMAVIGCAIFVIDDLFNLNMDKEAQLGVVGVVASYVVGQGIADKK